MTLFFLPVRTIIHEDFKLDEGCSWVVRTRIQSIFSFKWVREELNSLQPLATQSKESYCSCRGTYQKKDQILKEVDNRREKWGPERIELSTSRTRSGNHTTRPRTHSKRRAFASVIKTYTGSTPTHENGHRATGQPYVTWMAVSFARQCSKDPNGMLKRAI